MTHGGAGITDLWGLTWPCLTGLASKSAVLTASEQRSPLGLQEKGIFQQEVQSVSMNEKMMSDPSMMTGMMKKQMTGTAPHLVMGFLVNQFFAGFVMGKLPFTLSPRFKVMLQRGVDMSSLDVSYFTSLSFYILLLFGLKGILSLMFSADTIDESAVMKQSMAGASPVFDVKAEFNGEKQRFDLVRRPSDVFLGVASVLDIIAVGRITCAAPASGVPAPRAVMRAANSMAELVQS